MQAYLAHRASERPKADLIWAIDSLAGPAEAPFVALVACGT